MDIVTFLRLDGKPVIRPLPLRPKVTFAQLRDGYLKTIGNGAVENNTLYTSKIHLAHVADTLGPGFLMDALRHGDLQRHINRRSASAAAVTIKKELDTLRSAWNWANRMGHVQEDFPGAGLIYPKGEEKLPFMTWKEIERRIAAGGDPDELWECLYLRENEIEQFLDFVEKRKAPAWVYPMCLMAAHTGVGGLRYCGPNGRTWTSRQGSSPSVRRRRVRGKVTTRRVPISSRLKKALASLPAINGSLFGKLSVPGRAESVHAGRGQACQWSEERGGQGPHRSQAPTKWSVVKGYHVLRHSFISALANKGIDQRIIDELVGHQTGGDAEALPAPVPADGRKCRQASVRVGLCRASILS